VRLNRFVAIKVLLEHPEWGFLPGALLAWGRHFSKSFVFSTELFRSLRLKVEKALYPAEAPHRRWGRKTFEAKLMENTHANGRDRSIGGSRLAPCDASYFSDALEIFHARACSSLM
jgi:hypothetical protein